MLNAVADPAEVTLDVIAGKRDQSPVIYGTVAATLLLSDLLDQAFCGANLSAHYVRSIRAGLRRSIDRGGLRGEHVSWRRRELYRAIHAFNQVADEPEVIYVDLGADDPEAVLRHERAHSAQRKLGNGIDDIGHAGDPEAFLSHPLAQKAALWLIEEREYDDEPHTLISEIGAHLSEGAPGGEVMGLTGDETKRLRELYRAALVTTHGNDAYRSKLAHA